MKVTKDCKLHVMYDHYNRLFNSRCNLSFGTPGTYTCQMCYSLKIQLDSCTADNESRVLATKQELHLSKTDAFYDDLKEKSSLSKNDSTIETLQVWVYNLRFHACSYISRDLYMYDETIARKGPAETVSISKHIEYPLSKDVCSLYLFTDNCADQNNNNLMVWFLSNINLNVVTSFCPVTKTSRILKTESRGRRWYMHMSSGVKW
ncbi:hypothetical protein PR048_005247 [Dryococelus australis]|uniref:Uncharacterized protein n=1 Tax=Dryococelus australis TaxID=614101 RepID=A0ABQ9I7P6_9NEOP|nr:hypothetical protein PR048_005247 [Dryococelus australis]